MAACLRWVMGLSIASMFVVVPYVHYRATYDRTKRLRVVTPGKFYRCGQLTADGLREAIHRYDIRTVINLRDEDPNPRLPANYYFSQPMENESEVCASAGAQHVFLSFDLPSRERAPFEHAKVIDEFLKILDDPANYPVLLHCKAGEDRTGILTAVYRMEYEHWPVADALREMCANGFKTSAATTANDYIWAYFEHYHPRWQQGGAAPICREPHHGPGDCPP